MIIFWYIDFVRFYFIFSTFLGNLIICNWHHGYTQILDPIDGTRGFVKGSGALYVVCFLYESLFYHAGWTCLLDFILFCDISYVSACVPYANVTNLHWISNTWEGVVVLPLWYVNMLIPPSWEILTAMV